MRMSCQSAGLRTTVLALGFVALAATGVQADPIINYTTSGSIDSKGVNGFGVISFIPVSNGAFNAPSAFSLGDFQVAALPKDQSTTYTNTPFHITYLANSVNGIAPNPNETPLEVSGVLNGDVSGANQSNVVATFDPLPKSSFLTGAFKNSLKILDSPLSLVPSTTNNGQTSAQARLDTVPVPEPTSIALFVTTLAGLGVRHRVRTRRAA